MLAETVKSETKHKCCICGKFTNFIEINYQAPFCSDECVSKMDIQCHLELQKLQNQNLSSNEEEFNVDE